MIRPSKGKPVKHTIQENVSNDMSYNSKKGKSVISHIDPKLPQKNAAMMKRVMKQDMPTISEAEDVLADHDDIAKHLVNENLNLVARKHISKVKEEEPFSHHYAKEQLPTTQKLSSSPVENYANKVDDYLQKISKSDDLNDPSERLSKSRLTDKKKKYEEESKSASFQLKTMKGFVSDRKESSKSEAKDNSLINGAENHQQKNDNLKNSTTPEERSWFIAYENQQQRELDKKLSDKEKDEPKQILILDRKRTAQESKGKVYKSTTVEHHAKLSAIYQ